MVRIRLAFAPAALAGLVLATALAVACGDDEDPAVASEAGTPDGSLVDAQNAVPDAADAGVEASACRTPAGPGPACVADAAACERRTIHLSIQSSYPFALATDAENVYWVAQSGSDAAVEGAASAVVQRAAKNGVPTQRAVVLARGQERTTTLVRDEEDLYWIASRAVDGGFESTLRRLRGAKAAAECPACAAPEEVAAFRGLGVRLVRAAAGVLFAADELGVVRRLAREGSGPSFTVTEVETTSARPSLAAGAEHVFAGGGRTMRVVRAPIAGGATDPFVTMPDAGPDAALPGAHVLGADCAHVFGVRHTGAFWHSPADEPKYSATSATFDDALDIAADEAFVYVARRAGGGVVRASRDGTGATTLYTGTVWRLAVDDDGIYWGEHARGSLAGNIFMQTKK